ncbi:MAG: hypothetical protein KGV56_02460 [Gammaproteobacteria bacterium]|nr:hypothetical protein [Gammaproteobacteria bacterium]
MSNIREDGFIGEGTLYINRLDRPDLGYLEVGNATKLSVSMTSEVKERISKKRENYGAVLDTVIIPKAGELAITLDTFTHENLAMVFMGSLAKNEMTAQTIADEVVPGQVGRWLKLANGYLKAGTVVVKDSTDTPIPTDKVEVNERQGFIRLADDVAINTGDELKVNYETADLKQWVIQANTDSQVKCALILDGRNRVNGDDVTLEIAKATLSANGAFDIFSEDFNQLELSGRPEVADGQTASFVVKVKENA